MDMVCLAATRRCKMSAATSDSDDVGKSEGNYCAECFESLEHTKPANVTDEDVTDEAKAWIFSWLVWRRKGAYRYYSARAGSLLRQRSGLSGMVNV